MPRIDCTYFKTPNDFPSRPANDYAPLGKDMSNPQLLSIGPQQLKALAVRVAQLSDYKPTSDRGVPFYMSLVDMALRAEETGYMQGEDYMRAESSFKGAISFFIGMLAARAVSDEVYSNFPGFLFHLTDKNVVKYTSVNKKHPDFVKVDRNGKPIMLVEAKGTSGAKSTLTQRVNGAKSQLQAVKTITTLKQGVPSGPYAAKKLSKHAITSSFISDKNGNRWLEFCDIDPETDADAEVELVIDLDEAIASYYSEVMRLLGDSDDGKRDGDYLVRRYDSFRIGLKSELYELLTEHQENEGKGAESLFDRVRVELSDFSEPRNEGEGALVRENGILVEVFE